MGAVVVEGLREFNAALRRIPGDLSKITTQVHAEASKNLVTRTRGKAQARKGRNRFAAGFRASRGKNWAGLRFKATHPAAAGWIFGSIQYQRFEKPWIGPANNPATPGFGDFGPRSYAAGEAIRESMAIYERDYDAKMAKAFRGAFPR